MSTALYLLDTNILLPLARRGRVGNRIWAEYGLALSDVPHLYAFVSEAEVRFLAARNRWQQRQTAELELVLRQFQVASIERRDVLDAYVAIDAYSFSVGRDMGKNDLWIAAVANVYGATLLTTDRDFDHLAPDYLTRLWIDPALSAEP